MGQLKQLLPVNGRPIVRRCADVLIASEIGDIAVVLGRGHSAVYEALTDLRVNILFNDMPESEMADSVRAGLGQINPGSTGVIVALSDHPMVSVRTIRHIISLHTQAPDKIIIPLCRGKRGHPTLFPRAIIEQIFDGLTLRDIIRRGPDTILTFDVKDEGVITDIDTIDDYLRLCSNETEPSS